MVAAVEAHRPAAGAADFLEAEDLGPEFVQLFHVADIDHQVVDASGVTASVGVSGTIGVVPSAMVFSPLG